MICICDMKEMLSRYKVGITCIKLIVSDSKRFVDAYAQFICNRGNEKKNKLKIIDVLERVQPTDKTVLLCP